MKGQAFIGLPNEKAAAKALKEANGYVLFEKPMVVVSFSSSIYIVFLSLPISSFVVIVFCKRENTLGKPVTITQCTIVLW